jgi:hypothetical protein
MKAAFEICLVLVNIIEMLIGYLADLPVRIRVTIGPPHPLVCRKWHLIGDP